MMMAAEGNSRTMNPPKKLLFVLRQAPYGSTLAKDALDAILATSAYEQDLSIAFIDDGVFQLINNHKTKIPRLDASKPNKRIFVFLIIDFVSAQKLPLLCC